MKSKPTSTLKTQDDYARLSAALEQAQQAAQDTEDKLNDAEIRLREADAAVNAALGNAQRREDPGPALEQARSAHRAVAAEVRQYSATLEDLRSQCQTLRLELHTLGGGDIEQVLEAQRDADTAKQGAERLKGLIADHRAKLNGLPMQDLEAIENERARVLAAMALGEATQEDLDTLEQRRQAAIEVVAASSAERERLLSVIRGLELRLDEAKAEHERREQMRRQVLGWYLKQRMQDSVKDYANVAKDLLEKLGIVVGYSRLVDSIDPDSAMIGNAETQWNLQLPPARIGNRDLVEGLVDDAEYRKAASKALRASLQEQGVTLSANA
ncbi:hypothetical protein [Imhoffiella purpurea]|uniref:Uncharacterized protein n=1 Tax=Imhoffiella purpurea TaxID=1249627 RepID=W9VEX8_9GAMM|nr:hypothetical protein [Imhoffiella purpurea]EXJ14597.1 hypothetical protein D779_2291 [Imhoffiella purpurea]